eukprot:scaffold137014_cov31-Tisochrysis_lutea.AAC.2
MDIMNDPLWNKGMAFSISERDRLHLRGLLPPRVEALEPQCERVMRQLRTEPDPIRKNLQLQVGRWPKTPLSRLNAVTAHADGFLIRNIVAKPAQSDGGAAAASFGPLTCCCDVGL